MPQLFLYKGESCEGGIRKKGEECKRKDIYALRTEKPEETSSMTLVGKLPLLSSDDFGDACKEYREMCIRYNGGKHKDNKIMPERFDIEKNYSEIEVKLFISSQQEIIKKRVDYLNANIDELKILSLAIS